MQLTIIQFLVLGIIQGVTEWLPISSSGMITLAMSNLYGITDFNFLLRNALFLHLGTFFAALIYFRKEVYKLFSGLFNYKKLKNLETKKTLNFLILSTIITGIVGIIILKFLSSLNLNLTSKAINLFVGIFLLITAGTQIKVKQKGLRKISNIKKSDSFVAGLTQGLASLPGISRSGITISTLLLKKFDDTTALKLSFLMSLPIVLLGNIFLNINDLTFGITLASFFGLIFSFIFGLITIHGLMKISKRINFGWFVLIFAILMLLSLLI